MIKITRLRKQIELGCKLIKSYRLCLYTNFDSGIWTAINLYQHKITNIVLASVDGVYVGSGIVTEIPCMHDSNISVYVKPEFRRQKIGSQIYAKLDKPEEIIICPILLSTRFYNAANHGKSTIITEL